MRVLVLAPQPFYQERGTPIAVRLLLRALSERGDRVDLLTFAEGDSVDLPGLQIHRISPVPAVRGIKPGFSFKKVYCDFFLARAFGEMLADTRYDVVHATEESVFLAQFACRRRGIPFVYDMDSSMSGQIADRFAWTGWLGPLLRRIEASAMRSARVVVPMCEALAAVARNEGVESVYVLKDVSLVPSSNGSATSTTPPRSSSGVVPRFAAPDAVPSADRDAGSHPGRDRPIDLRDELGIGLGPLVLYIGNLEPYQGIDLLLESFVEARRQLPESAAVVLIGGAQRDVETYRLRARTLGLESSVHLVGPQPVGWIDEYMQQADLLVSPRVQGENTPMKLYTYLDSGVAVLATDLPTHRQVVDTSQAGLARPEASAFATEMVRLLESSELRSSLAGQAKKLIRTQHSFPVFMRRVHHLYTWLENGGPLDEPAGLGRSRTRG